MSSILTAEQVAAARDELGLSVTQMAEALRLTMPNGRTTIREWESGRRQISGPASVAIDAMLCLKRLLDLDQWEGAAYRLAIEMAEDLIFAGETS
jgi:transcriptional regulator with XRE-family HTH domain